MQRRAESKNGGNNSRKEKIINENLTVPMAHVPTGWYRVKAQCLAMHSR
jgi:hypothetical protein